MSELHALVHYIAWLTAAMLVSLYFLGLLGGFADEPGEADVNERRRRHGLGDGKRIRSRKMTIRSYQNRAARAKDLRGAPALVRTLSLRRGT